MDAITYALKKTNGSAALAQKLGMSRQRVDNWRRRGAIPPGQVIAVAQAIDCDPMELYQRNQPPATGESRSASRAPA
ncbi:YdaS family helix-turn-helix protein [Thioalkalivibrio sp. ALJ8]|uniref:YdaS family helix-turn-helix protein n=1 Tax=Thioalkalivibrio sp. ALJ8 TaxID=1158757 RepID=UPI00037FC86F|nr:YdaS family helix-turn-helix protein [Thioalkalivibrio sp. ALJ8]